MTEARPFSFFTPSGTLAGHIHRPTRDLITAGPAVIVSGSWLTVKEQMADRYATELARLGYTAFTFDFTGFGGSSGNPRQTEIPTRKVADITAVAHAVSSLSFVRQGIGYLAVCASAQYAARAIVDGAPIAALASVAGWFHDTDSVSAFYGGTEGVRTRLERGSKALSAYETDGSLVTVPAYDEGNDRAGMFLPLDYYGSSERGAIPEWTNEMAELTWLYWLTYDGLSATARLRVPTLFVHSDECVLPDNVKRLAGTIRTSELMWSDGAQIDFYDQDEQVTAAVAAADVFFSAQLPLGGPDA